MLSKRKFNVWKGKEINKVNLHDIYYTQKR